MDIQYQVDPTSEKIFNLYTNCKIVNGFSRSIIYDLQRNTFDFIPNDLSNLIREFSGKEIRLCFSENAKDDHETINEYFNFLIEKEYIYLLDEELELTQFPDLDLSWDAPSIITNAIIDFDLINFNAIQIDVYKKLVSDLDDLGCYHIQLRFFGQFDIDTISNLLNLFNNLDVSLELIIHAIEGWKINDYNQYYLSHPLVVSISVYNACLISREGMPILPQVIFFNELISDSSHCGKISPGYFTVSVEFFTESITFNSCLNRKIGIDSKGEIKNCPTMVHSYGSIYDTTIKDVINDRDFQGLWMIKKDQIETCKICEFRHMCSDCRAFNNNIYEKPFKCSYDPRLMVWN